MAERLPKTHGRRAWVPALGRWRSVDFYERLMRRFSLDDLPETIADDLRCEAGTAVLDLGCGPGSLAAELRRRNSGARVVGLDPDVDMLRRARERTSGGMAPTLGLAQALPFADETFDRVTATLFLHHLTRPQKMQALEQAWRVLRPGGQLLVTDWTKPHGAAAGAFLIVRVNDGFAQTADNAAGRIEELIESAGFSDVQVPRRRELWLGTIAHLRALKPGNARSHGL